MASLPFFYRIIFMQRNLDEVLASQEKMLRRRDAAGVPREQMREAFTIHLEKLFDWLREQRNMNVVLIHYNELLEDPREHAEKVSEFLDDTPIVKAMIQTVDPVLYRNRKTVAQV